MAEQFDPTLQTLMHSIIFWPQAYCFAFITAICFDSFQLLGTTGVLELAEKPLENWTLMSLLKLNAIKPSVLCSYLNYHNYPHIQKIVQG